MTYTAVHGWGETEAAPIRLGCSSCIYEASAGLRKTPATRHLIVPEATREVATSKGLRQVCDAHARALLLPGGR